MIGPEDWSALCAIGRREHQRSGQYLFYAGDAGGAAFAVIRGRVLVTGHRPDGTELQLGEAGAGELVGELSAIDNGRRSTTAVTATDCDLVRIANQELRDLITARPVLGWALLEQLAARLRSLNDAQMVRSSGTIPDRVRQRLAELVDSSGDTDLPLGREELAAWLHTSRESVSRSLGALRDEGVVELGRGRIRVTDVAALRERRHRS